MSRPRLITLVLAVGAGRRSSLRVTPNRLRLLRRRSTSVAPNQIPAFAPVIVQLVPTMRDGRGRTLHPAAVTGLLAGIAVMFMTGLLVSV